MAPKTARQTEALEPWHPNRTHVTIAEVGCLLKKIYGITIGPQSVHRWIHKGSVTPDGKRVFLVAKKIGYRVIIKKSDLMAFLDAGERSNHDD